MADQISFDSFAMCFADMTTMSNRRGLSKHTYLDLSIYSRSQMPLRHSIPGLPWRQEMSLRCKSMATKREVKMRWALLVMSYTDDASFLFGRLLLGCRRRSKKTSRYQMHGAFIVCHDTHCSSLIHLFSCEKDDRHASWNTNGPWIDMGGWHNIN